MMVTLVIDDRSVTVPKGTTILQAAQGIGIDIPTFCYDKDLTVFGGCRICVVEVEGSRALTAACATAASDGMVVLTESPNVVEARRNILELILANHPLDCLTCEKAGTCKLQEYCYRYEVKGTTFENAAGNIPIDSENPCYERDMNKCILCGKCIRVCKEVQVSYVLNFAGRGAETKAIPAFDMPISTDNCRLCGQCVEMCPTGAIIHKQLKGTRPWEVEKVRTTCPFCGTGCSFDLNVKDGKVIGVTATDEAIVNGRSLCVKGRYHADFMYSPERITTPLVKKDGKFVEATWDEALSLVGCKFKEIKKNYGPNALAGLSSARCVNEDSYIFQKLFRVAIGTNNIDHCART
jgi:predicted molibdopterin-dependent oxidoreductase YjgC